MTWTEMATVVVVGIAMAATVALYHWRTEQLAECRAQLTYEMLRDR